MNPGNLKESEIQPYYFMDHLYSGTVELSSHKYSTPCLDLFWVVEGIILGDEHYLKTS